MPNRCVAYGCSNTSQIEGISTYTFPENSSLRAKRIAQVCRTRDKWSGPKDTAALCSNHFLPECFEEGYTLCKSLGLKRKRKLKKGTAPTVFKRGLSDGLMPETKKTKANEKRQRARVNSSVNIVNEICL